MGANVANDDLKCSFANTAGPPDISADPPDQSLGGALVAGTSASCDAPSGKNIRTGSVDANWTLAGACLYTSVLYSFTSGILYLPATATKTKCDGVVPLRLGDAAVCAGIWTLIADGVTTVPCTCNVEIADAGQIKVKAL